MNRMCEGELSFDILSSNMYHNVQFTQIQESHSSLNVIIIPN